MQFAPSSIGITAPSVLEPSQDEKDITLPEADELSPEDEGDIREISIFMLSFQSQNSNNLCEKLTNQSPTHYCSFV